VTETTDAGDRMIWDSPYTPRFYDLDRLEERREEMEEVYADLRWGPFDGGNGEKATEVYYVYADSRGAKMRKQEYTGKKWVGRLLGEYRYDANANVFMWEPADPYTIDLPDFREKWSGIRTVDFHDGREWLPGPQLALPRLRLLARQSDRRCARRRQTRRGPRGRLCRWGAGLLVRRLRLEVSRPPASPRHDVNPSVGRPANRSARVSSGRSFVSRHP